MDKLDSKLRELIVTFRKLRDPEKGCPWDKEQDFKSITRTAICDIPPPLPLRYI